MSLLTNRAVTVINLGRMGFMAAHDVQMRFARKHLDELADKPYTYGENTLLLVEHPPVFTIGIRTKDYTPEDESRLKETGAEFYKTNRGGLITFHGPGQLVAYPVLNLQHFKPSMKWYVCQLEQTMVKMLKTFGLEGRTTDQTGVWVGEKKIGAIGLHGSRYVTTHGVSINCNTDLTWYRHIVPCGLQGVRMTSISKELSKNITFQDAVTPFLRSFQESFECDMEFKMLEENELKTIANPMTVGGDSLINRFVDAGQSAIPHGKRAEMGHRNMSTMSGGGTHLFIQEKSVPMW
ncbi:putative lipoyltransferase 2, mitochondrial [Physella acuta]|uniref:putative lipoyltransferase 2, mitochondrial n=1 Tax=Physella acuta TaxID=109671 RepID=UPI0027DD26C7|nr:putative lipoyltransferase 2, mitochondrial [Physella acuta]XP_059171105.1 putative lipoyltransferase 2, mitochondrial [Physella acuta]XP_059171114.1 putative lipoyltransferase 2, mitochondrial [Physella acuta]XP_059171124.1 putative lipoyltransferase 2, mitochondrial [Physella acuta]